MKNSNGYVLPELLLSLAIIVLLSGTLLPLVITMNKTIDKQLKEVKLYQILFYQLQSKSLEPKLDMSKYYINRSRNEVCIKDIMNNEKVCVVK